MSTLRSAPARYLLLLLGSWLTVFTLTRLVLLLAHLPQAAASPLDTLTLFARGMLYDLGFLAMAALPLALYLLLLPQRIWQHPGHQRLMEAVHVLSLFAMLFVALSEWLFWDEFGVRFNFIAVDYLVYSDEVLHNILESYPVGSLLTVIGVLACGLTLLLRRPLRASLQANMPGLAGRGLMFASLASLAAGSALVLDQQFPRGSGGNAYQRELASNGPFQFFAAFRNNELDYPTFYPTLAQDEVAHLLNAELGQSGDSLQIRRQVQSTQQPTRLNVVLVTVESLSAKYLGSFGDRRGLTPNLDALRQHSLSYSNLYATGTRTARGLEAITLSVPPTPGRSIVKRIGHEAGYASLGQQFAAQGYDSAFIYGGRGYFDNMNAFFAGNGYRIIDQASADPQDIQFTNAWGMADEDLYSLTLKEADKDFAAGRPFFLQLMTTSNHRPYTFPAGRIDLPSGDGREAAVKYTDWAIGDFLARARQKPWFDDTLFVFVADHCAGSDGKEDLPVANYHIPLFIYAPKWVQAREDAQLASQIDLAPTLLGLLDMSYESTFFGRDLNQPASQPPRALIGTYQHLGLFDGKDLAILSPNRQMRIHEDALGRSREHSADLNDPRVRRDIAWYQAASSAYQQGLLAWHNPLRLHLAHQTSKRDEVHN